jgi:cholesterol 7alpha-monooxygenase
MVRKIAEDTQFEMEDGQTYKLREGDRVAMYPPAIHKDPDIFENPNVNML